MRTAKAIALAAAVLIALPTGTAAADPPGTKTIPSSHSSYKVGLGPGRAYLTVQSTPQSITRHAYGRISGGEVILGPEEFVGDYAGGHDVAVSANRVLYGPGLLRYEGSATVTKLSPIANSIRRLSGNRALFFEATGYDNFWPALYNIRTGAKTNPFGTGEPGSRRAVDLWGEYFVYASPDGSVHRRDLRTGTTVTVKGPGTKVLAVAVYAARVAWLTACPTSNPCDQTLNWRTVGSGPVSTVTTRETSSMRLGGGSVVYKHTFAGFQQLIAVNLASKNVQVIESSDTAVTSNYDLDDETVAWIDGDDAKIAPLPAHKESPRYLGNAIGAASVHPPTLWRGAFPLSKPLTDCKVTFRKNGTPVRIIGCANTTKTGLATVAWNGKTGSGKPVSNGTYTWTLTGSDTDGKLLWYNGSGSAITGTVKVV